MCVLLLLGPLGRFVSLSAAWLDYPYPRAGSEGLILYESLLLKHGGDIYAPITPQRFISGPYPPLYYGLAAATLPDTLPSFAGPAQPPAVLRGGRIISLLAALLSAALAALIVAFEAKSQVWGRGRAGFLIGAGTGLIGSLLFLTLPQTMVWATRFRGDMLATAFTAAGLLCILLSRGAGPEAPGVYTPRSLLLLPAALLFALAFFTKQTALAGPLASAVYLLLHDRRTALRWCVLMAAFVGVPFLALDVATGHWFYLKMVSYHSLPLRWTTLSRLLQFAFWEDQWPVILAALGYTAYRLVGTVRGMAAREKSRPSLIALFALTSFALLPTGAVTGADHNHLLMVGLALALATGGGLAPAAVRLWTGNRSLPVLASLGTLLALVAVYALFTSPPSSWYGPDLTVPPPDVQEQYRKIVYNVAQNPGNLFFADDPGIIALAGKQTPYDDPFTMTALAEEGRWDEAALLRSLREGKFSLLALSCDVNTPQFCRADTFSPGALEAIRLGYRVLFRDILYTYAPDR